MSTSKIPSRCSSRCFDMSATIGVTLLITGLVLVALGKLRYNHVKTIRQSLVLAGATTLLVGTLSTSLAVHLFLKLTG